MHGVKLDAISRIAKRRETVRGRADDVADDAIVGCRHVTAAVELHARAAIARNQVSLASADATNKIVGAVQEGDSIAAVADGARASDIRSDVVALDGVLSRA